MPAPLWTEKTQYFITPDGDTLTYHSTRDCKFALITQDPKWRILYASPTRKNAEKKMQYFQKIWPDDNYRLVIVRRCAKEYIS